MISSFLAAMLIASPLFDVRLSHWDGTTYPVTLSGGSAICAWPGRRVTITPQPIDGAIIEPLFRCERRGRSFRFAADGASRRLGFRVRQGGKTSDTWLQLLIPVPVVTDSRGIVIVPASARGFPLGLFPDEVPRRLRSRSAALSSRFYLVTDTSLRISPHYTLGDFVSKTRPGRAYHGPPYLLALDYGLVAMLEAIQAEWNRLGWRGLVRIESPFRTPDYNNAGEAGRAEFSLHMYGSACDFILTETEDHLHDDVDRDGDRDLEDLLPLARRVEQMMREDRIPRGGLGVYRYIHRDGRSEEFTIHADIRGWIGKWGSLYDSDTVRAAARIDW